MDLSRPAPLSWVVALLLALLTTACYRPCSIYDELEPVVSRPTTAELEGNYRPTAATERSLRARGITEKTGQVTLGPGNRLVYSAMPGLPVAGLGKRMGESINATGSWEFYFDEPSHTGGLLVKTGADQSSWRIYRRNGKLALFRFIGDPDGCSILLYSKE